VKHVLTAVVSRFVTLYGEPRTDNAEALYSEYVRALKDFDEEALNLAVDEVVRMHTFPTWPTPGEVYKQALSEAAKLYAKRPKPRYDQFDDLPASGKLEPSEEEKARNRAIIEEMKRVHATRWRDGPEMPTPDRAFMEQLQDKAINTVDGRLRHLKGWRPNLGYYPTGEQPE
jgi:hypothetical protein